MCLSSIPDQFDECVGAQAKSQRLFLELDKLFILFLDFPCRLGGLNYTTNSRAPYNKALKAYATLFVSFKFYPRAKSSTLRKWTMVLHLVVPLGCRQRMSSVLSGYWSNVARFQVTICQAFVFTLYMTCYQKSQSGSQWRRKPREYQRKSRGGADGG